MHAAADRRAFVQGVAAAAFFSAVTPVFAEDVDDLAMPSQDEEAKTKSVRRGIIVMRHYEPPPVSRLFFATFGVFFPHFVGTLLLLCGVGGGKPMG
jgi:hypothetical protein